MLASVHSATAVPIGAPLNRSSHRPSGRPIHTGHISARSNCQQRKNRSPRGGSTGELAISGSISGKAEANSTLAIGKKIGRASWRERVRQYVYIPVGDGSLKNKKKK